MSVIRAIQTISILFLVAAGWIFTRGVAVLDEARTEPMAEPTAIERFLRDRGDKKDGRDYLPPLVQQAQAFALYLNPPRPPAPTPAPKPPAAPAEVAKTGSDPKPPAPVQPPAASPKFELHGISYYRAQPERSMALVREPGGSRRWVRPGQQLGHLTIERIESTTLICRDATQTHVIALMADEAVAKYAQGLKDTPAPGQIASPTRKAQPAVQGPIVPPPTPGIRQMPASRVAAMLGGSPQRE